jgi:hypothetical protein
VKELTTQPTSFFIHPEIFKCLLEGAKEIRAQGTALKIIQAIIQVHNPSANVTAWDTQGNPKGKSSNSRSNSEEGQDARANNT